MKHCTGERRSPLRCDRLLELFGQALTVYPSGSWLGTGETKELKISPPPELAGRLGAEGALKKEICR